MTRAENVAEAQRLRAEGLLLREVAERMGAPFGTVYDWLYDPDRSKRRERQRLYRRRHPRYGKDKCECGQLKRRDSRMCMGCIRVARDERWRKIEAWWGEGLSMKAICRRLGWSYTGRLALELNRMREAGRDVPYRYRVRAAR